MELPMPWAPSPPQGGEAGERAPDSELTPDEVALYRKTAATLNFLAQDRADLCFASHTFGRMMSSPKKEDLKRARQTIRYLKSKPGLEVLFRWQEECGEFECHTDSDWATCPITRKSVTGGAIIPDISDARPRGP